MGGLGAAPGWVRSWWPGCLQPWRQLPGGSMRPSMGLARQEALRRPHQILTELLELFPCPSRVGSQPRGLPFCVPRFNPVPPALIPSPSAQQRPADVAVSAEPPRRRLVPVLGWVGGPQGGPPAQTDVPLCSPQGGDRPGVRGCARCQGSRAEEEGEAGLGGLPAGSGCPWPRAGPQPGHPGLLLASWGAELAASAGGRGSGPRSPLPNAALCPQPCGRSLNSILGKSNLKFAGMPITLTISTSSLNLMASDCKQVRGRGWAAGSKRGGVVVSPLVPAGGVPSLHGDIWGLLSAHLLLVRGAWLTHCWGQRSEGRSRHSVGGSGGVSAILWCPVAHNQGPREPQPRGERGGQEVPAEADHCPLCLADHCQPPHAVHLLRFGGRPGEYGGSQRAGSLPLARDGAPLPWP